MQAMLRIARHVARRAARRSVHFLPPRERDPARSILDIIRVAFLEVDNRRASKADILGHRMARVSLVNMET